MDSERPVQAHHVVVHDRGHDLSGVVRDGESWAGAAHRVAASLHADPTPVDLSGVVKQFVIDHDNRVTIRAMTRGDLGDLTRWHRSEHLRRWWRTADEPTAERIAERYGPRIDALTPTRMWVAEVNGRSVGFLQDYRIGDHPDYAVLGAPPDAVGVDYALGEEWSGRGYGPRVLWAWMLRARRRFPDVRTYFAAPDHRNAASLRVLAKVGFTAGVWFDEPNEIGSVDTVVGCTLDVGRVLG